MMTRADGGSWEYMKLALILFSPMLPEEMLVMFRRPNLRKVKDLSGATGYSRRTMGRWTDSRRLPPPSIWLRFACYLRALERMHLFPDHSIDRCARHAGFADGFTYSNALFRDLGVRPTSLRSWTVIQFIKHWCDTYSVPMPELQLCDKQFRVMGAELRCCLLAGHEDRGEPCQPVTDHESIKKLLSVTAPAEMALIAAGGS